MMHEKYVHMSIFFVAFYFGSQNFHLSHFFVVSCKNSVTQKIYDCFQSKMILDLLNLESVSKNISPAAAQVEDPNSLPI